MHNLDWIVHRAAKIDFWNASKTLYLKVAGTKKVFALTRGHSNTRVERALTRELTHDCQKERNLGEQQYYCGLS